MKIGHRTFAIRSIFLNLSAIAIDRILPTRSRATSFMDLNGDINIKAAGERYRETNIAGEHPIERPKIIISLWCTFRIRFKWSYINRAS